MLKYGWFRLWLVAVATTVSAFLSIVAYGVWGQEACYRFVTISSKAGTTSEESEFLKVLEQEAKSRQFCGRTLFSLLLTVEQRAKEGLVEQVTVQWREPRGWSFSEFDSLDVFNSKQIRASTILSHVNRYVHEARLRSFIPWAIGIGLTSIASLLVGLGVNWIRRGFSESSGQLIAAMYGNSPPNREADLDLAVQLASEALLGGLISVQQVTEVATALLNTAIPYSTNELALASALAYFVRPEFAPRLQTAQLNARLLALQWAKENKVTPMMFKNFEDTLYKRYKPEDGI